VLIVIAPDEGDDSGEEATTTQQAP
jgi:hypothetical protein